MDEIDKLLRQLDDVSAWGERDMSRSYLLSLCKQSAAAIRHLQAFNKASVHTAHAHFLKELGGKIAELGQRLDGHA